MASLKKVKTGVIGCGNISNAYFDGMKKFEILDVAACSDLDLDRAKASAAKFGIARACSVAELLADPAIELVVNLTVPKAHAPVNLDVINAGKSVHVEKPWALDRAQGKQVLDAAAAKKVLCGAAPDTFFGDGIQTGRKLLDDGCIGRPVAATIFMVCPGHESWHPSPEFYYEVGGGPLFDMGPYYLTALVNLLGPVKSVSASARITHPTRTITSAPKYGKVVTVETPTHIAATLDFASGVVGTMIMSFDIPAHRLPLVEIYGDNGTLSVPDPNGFGGPVLLKTRAMNDFVAMRATHGNGNFSRGVGPADMAYAIRTGRPHRASGALAYHVLDIMQSTLESSEQGRRIDLTSSCARPAPVPMTLPAGQLDE